MHLPSCNAIHAHFTLAGRELPVTHFTLLEAISRPTELQISLRLSHAQDLASWLGQRVVFHLKMANGLARDWVLICEKANLEQSGRGHLASLVCRSAWGACFHAKRTQRVFCQERVPELVNFILSEQGLCADQTKWQLSHEDWEREQIVQCTENDGEFIQRIAGRENMQWFSRVENEQEVLHFVDHPQFLEKRKEALVYHPKQVFEERGGVGIFECESFQRGALQEREWLDEMPLRLYSGVPCLQAGFKSAGMPVKPYQPLSYEPSLFKKALEKRRITKRDFPKSGYRAVRFQSNALDLAPGLIIELAQGDHRVNYVLHEGDLTQGDELLIYHNTVIAQDCQSPWRGLLNPRPLMPLVFQAKIESAHALTHLDTRGRETLRSLLDSHLSKNTRASIPIPRLTPYAHSKGGMQCPLYPGTEVLISCLEGEADLPMILGAVYNNIQNSPVNHVNPRLNVLRSQQDQALVFDDTPTAPHLFLSTQSGHHWLMRNKENPGFFVKCIGGMIYRSKGKFTWHTGVNFLLWAGKTYRQRASVGQAIITKEGNIVFKAALNLKNHALDQLRCYAKRHLKVFARNQAIAIKMGQSIIIQQGDASFTVKGASLIETPGSIVLCSLAGDLSLTNLGGSCGMTLTQSGTIRLFGKQLIANTELQKEAGQINHF